MFAGCKKTEKRATLPHIDSTVFLGHTILDQDAAYNCAYAGNVTRDNYRYLLDNLGNRKDINELFRDIEKSKKSIRDRLGKYKHIPYNNSRRGRDCYKKIEKNYKKGLVDVIHDGTKGVNLLNPVELLKFYLLFDALEKEDFKEQVRAEIQKDLHDDESEHGGFIKINNGKLSLFPVKSVLDYMPPNTHPNYFYDIPPKLKDTERHVFHYHFHATDVDSSDYCGPSPGDISILIDHIRYYGALHHVVFTSLPEKKFNVAYYGGERISEDEIRVNILSLGNR